jgi:hypothetical protein
MRKGWLIAGAVAATAGAAQAAEVELFGIHTPSLGKWAVYARISDVNSTAGDGLEVVGLSSIGINVLNNTAAGVGTSTVTSSVNTLPKGVSKYVDTTRWPEAPEGVGYGFWIKDLRKDGTIGADGAREISATQYAIYPKPVTTIPYQRLVLTGVGLTPGAVVQNDTTGGDYKTSTSWAGPVQVASGNYTPAGTTGAGANLGLKLSYIDATSGSVNLLRPVGTDFAIEAPTKASVTDARNFTLGQNNVSDFTTIKAGQGDANLDGQVNFNDLLILARNYGKDSKSWFEGDFDYSGAVNFSDLLALAKNYGKPVPSSPEFSASFNADVASAFAAVPEPGTLSVLGLGAIGVMGRRRRK